jgi:clan AA aspartic protease (TIGR02281 family)
LARSSRVVGRLAHGGVLLVPVRVNGQDFEFLVDTGSVYTGVASSTAAYLGLSARMTPGVWIAPAHGRTVRLPTATIEVLSVGGHRVERLDALILELPSELQIDGLLGMDVLGRFRITVEPDTATLILRPVRTS